MQRIIVARNVPKVLMGMKAIKQNVIFSQIRLMSTARTMGMLNVQRRSFAEYKERDNSQNKSICLSNWGSAEEFNEDELKEALSQFGTIVNYRKLDPNEERGL